VDRAKRVNELEAELDRVDADLADVRETVADLDDRLSEREALEERRAEIVSELADLRDRVDQVESEAVEAFNGHMATVLEMLDYDNVERIWIERTTASRDRRSAAEDAEFDLHVVRSADGTAYEDTVAHLSESEREVTGLVFALAGYLWLVGEAGNAAGIWVLWGFLSMLVTFMGSVDPIDDQPLDRRRSALGVLTFVLGALCFMPIPIQIVG
jgi:hypothetical protein